MMHLTHLLHHLYHTDRKFFPSLSKIIDMLNNILVRGKNSANLEVSNLQNKKTVFPCSFSPFLVATCNCPFQNLKQGKVERDDQNQANKF